MKKGRIFLITLLIITIWLLSGMIICWIAPEFETRGQIGDMFGAANALFSGLAFVALIYTISQQQKEINTQNKESKESQLLSTLTSLVTVYSYDEEKYFGVNNKKSEIASKRKSEILIKIEEILKKQTADDDTN